MKLLMAASRLLGQPGLAINSMSQVLSVCHDHYSNV